jgi:hypothetical protein
MKVNDPQFPDGKISLDDEGRAKVMISHDENLVRLDFGKPLAWLAMPKSQALQFVFVILEHCGVQIEHKVQQPPQTGQPS